MEAATGGASCENESRGIWTREVIILSGIAGLAKS